jgi:hypothetical protein
MKVLVKIWTYLVSLEVCELSVLVQACTRLHKHQQEICENTDVNFKNGGKFMIIDLM